MGVELSQVVTWQDAEDAMLAAVEYLGAMPDKERGWLRGGQGWPDIVRDVRAGDYGDGQGHGGDAEPRRQLGRKEMAVLDRMMLGPQAACLAVPEEHRRLVGRVLIAKLDPRGDVFRWERIWVAEGGKRCVVTSDALRMRYERAIGKVAVAMERGRDRAGAAA
ncbi:hypothetical protein [Croceicoccus sp. BE223]|uniref:hypothetical protein n=1 Tax=Croceicoccus sp. BE223 TaxID=2817716 RepID=UPI00285EDBA9|nr:hypothetical protein [Croceicoccus sp. BE223]MDR7101511.1 hypothetical protein [Croceicoccus sp. BE223]